MDVRIAAVWFGAAVAQEVQACRYTMRRRVMGKVTILTSGALVVPQKVFADGELVDVVSETTTVAAQAGSCEKCQYSKLATRTTLGPARLLRRSLRMVPGHGDKDTS